MKRAISMLERTIGVLLLVAVVILATKPSPAGPLRFGVLLLGPIAGCALIDPRGTRWAFFAAAVYAAAAGINTLYHPSGDMTVAEQVSTAALVAFAIPLVARFVMWIRSVATAKKRDDA